MNKVRHCYQLNDLLIPKELEHNAWFTNIIQP